MNNQSPVTLPNKPAELPLQYRRNIVIENVILDRTDIVNLMSIVQSKTYDAHVIQIASEDSDLFESQQKLSEEVRRVFRINYELTDSHGNTLSGYDVIDVNSGGFPDNLNSIYLSNSAAFKIAANGRLPQNAVDIFIDFKRAPIAINFRNLPSNPTDNGSVVNVYGFNEDWVISTHQKLKEFFDNRKSQRGFIHRSGIYDLLLYGVYIPIILWTAFRIEFKFPVIFEEISAVFLAGLYIYGFLICLILARVLFQYIRWLLPIVEYKPERSTAPKVHRRVIGVILMGLGLTFLADVMRTVFF